MGSYVPSTLAERQEMLESIGLSSIEQLFTNIQEEVKVSKLNIPAGKSELEVRTIMEALAEKNKIYPTIFRGAGAYNHYIPAIVKSVTSKEEFITSYTPYQAEISQGLLQSIFEYQTMICELTGMEVSNASVYDGASAAAEAIAMCIDRKRKKFLVSESSHPMVITTMQTYCHASGAKLEIVPTKEGLTDMSALEQLLDDQIAGVYLQQPNFYGLIENAEDIGDLVHKNGSKFVMGVNPIASAMVKTAGESGADIAVGEGQPLGLALSFGGPYLGFVTCTKELLRKIPGRIVGETVDLEGKRAYVLTMQAREQHIRREKATSNICSNQAHCALTAAVYLSAMGEAGMKQAASLCLSKAHYAAGQLSKIKGFELRYSGEFFNEFITECPIDIDILMKKLSDHNILGGYPVDGGILWCVTEMNTKEQIDRLVQIIREAME